jgi:hypothetical protein
MNKADRKSKVRRTSHVVCIGKYIAGPRKYYARKMPVSVSDHPPDCRFRRSHECRRISHLIVNFEIFLNIRFSISANRFIFKHLVRCDLSAVNYGGQRLVVVSHEQRTLNDYRKKLFTIHDAQFTVHSFSHFLIFCFSDHLKF